MSFFKGMAAGVAVGTVIGMAVMPKKKKFSIGKALRSVGDAVDSVAGTISR